MLDVLNHLIQAVEKLVMQSGATPNGMVPALIQQAQDSLQRAKDAWAVETAPGAVPSPASEPPAPSPVAEAPAPDPAPEEAAVEQSPPPPEPPVAA